VVEAQKKAMKVILEEWPEGLKGLVAIIQYRELRY